MKKIFNPALVWLPFVLFLCLVNPSQAAVNLAVELGPNPVQRNEVVNVAITVANPGGSSSGAITVRMLYPSGLDSVSHGAISDVGTCPVNLAFNGFCDPSETVVWNLGNISAGSGRTLILPPSVINNATTVPDGTVIPFAVEVLENGILQAQVSRNVVVRSAPAFDIAVDEDANPVGPGEPLTYTVTYSNRAAANALNTTLSLPLPPGVTFVSATGGGALNGNTVQWNLNTLPAKAGGRQKVRVTVNNSVTQGSLLEVDAAAISGLVNSLSNTSTALAVTRVQANSPLALGLELNPDPVLRNEVINAQLTVTNRSNAPLSGVTLRLRYPTSLDSVSHGAISDAGTCPVNLSFNGFCDPREVVVWELGNLPAGGGRTVSLPPSVINNATTVPDGTLITFDAEVTEDNQRIAAESRTLLVDSDPAFDIAVDEDANPVGPGESLIYTVTYSNRAAANSLNTNLSLPLPAGVTFVSATGGGVLNGNTVQWNLNTLPAKTGGRQKVKVTVNNSVTQGSLLEVDAATITGLVNSLSNTSTALAVTRVQANSPLALGLELNPDPVLRNEVINAQLTVTNRSNAPLSGVTLRLRYPTSLDSVSHGAISDAGTCPVNLSFNGFCDPREVVVWELGNLPAGGGRTVSLPPSVINNATTVPDGTLITFDAEVTEDNQRIAAESRTLLVDSDPAFDIAVDEDANPVGLGEPLIYTVTYSNRAAANSLNTNLSLPLPAGVTFVSATGGGVLNGNTVQWNLNTLPAKTGGRQKVKVTVNNSVTQGSLLEVDAATITGLVNSLSNTSTALAVTRVQANNLLALGLVLNPDPVLRNQAINTSLIVTNQTNATLFGVTLRLRFPTSVNSVAFADISDTGTCPVNLSFNGFCDPTEFVVWNLGNISANASRTVSLSPIVLNNATTVPDGTLIAFDAFVSEDTGTQTSASQTDLVGVYGDTDTDGVSDNIDNCTLVANANQTDTDGDKIGNACDPDFNQNNIVDQFDFSRLKSCFGKTASVCPNEDLNGNGVVDQFDFSRLKSLFGKKPGPSGLVN